MGRYLPAAIVGVLLLAGAVLVGRPPAPEPSIQAPAVASARRSVAVLGLRNASGDAGAAWLSTALTELLALELRAGDRLRTVSGETVARARHELRLPDGGPIAVALLPRARARLGAELLLGGEYTAHATPSGWSLDLELAVHDARTGRRVAHARADGQDGALVELVSQAGGQLREQLGVLSRGGAVRAADGLSRDPRALRLHAEGLDRLRRFDAHGALERLQEGVLLDPGSAQLHATLAAAAGELGFEQRAKDASRRAFELAADLPLGDRLPIEAGYRERAGDWAAAADIHRTLSSRDPGNVEHVLALAAAELNAGHAETALTLLAELRRNPDAALDARVDLLESRAHSVRGDVRRSLELAESAVVRGRRLGARTLVADALLAVSEGSRRTPDLGRSRDACEQARALFAESGDRGGVARALAERATVEWYAGEFAAARQAAEHSLATAREIGDRASAGRALNTLAGLLGDEGRLAEARRMYVETLALATEVADLDREWVATHNIGIILWKMGDLPTARRALDESLVLAGKLGSGRREAFSRFHIGQVLLDQGDLEGAATAFTRSAELARMHGLHSFAADPLYGLGRVKLERDDVAGARQAFEESIAIRQQRGPTSFRTATILGTAVVALEQGEHRLAEQRATEAADAFRHDRARTHEAMALAVVALAQARQGRGALADASAAAASARLPGSEAATVRLETQALLGTLALERAGGPARELLEATLVESRKAGLRAVQFECRLGLARLAEATDPARATAERAALVRDTEAAGFLRLARHARHVPPRP